MTELDEEQSRNPRLQNVVDKVFSDDVMIALALVLAAVVILQFLFEFSPGMHVFFEYLNYIVIAAFVAEYVSKLYLTESRGSFVINSMHILDLIIIFLALLDFSRIDVSIFPDQTQLSLSPILRLLRVLPRIMPRMLLAIILAGRTAKRIDIRSDPLLPPIKPLQISTFDTGGNVKRYIEKEVSCSIVSSDTPLWIDSQYLKESDLETIENCTKISQNMLETKLIKESFPRIDHFEGFPTIFLWDSHIESDNPSTETLNITTNDLLVVCSDHNIITLSKDKSDLFDKISRELLPLKEEDFTVRILYSLLRQKMIDYSEIVQRIEQKTIGFEEIPVVKTSPQFLEETFHFKKEIQKISSNLWHFHQVLHQLIDKKNLSLLGIKDSNEFDNLHAESEYLYQTAQNIKESLISLIELHINTVSYDMNRVMKVIAVITCLAIIPSIVGGLLGENLTEGNFPIKLTEIFFIVFSLMLLGVYAFYKMDWLK